MPQPMGLPLSLAQEQLSFHSGTWPLIPGPALPALLPGVSVSHILELLTHASNFLIFTFSLSSCLIMFVDDVHNFYLRLSNPSAENV